MKDAETKICILNVNDNGRHTLSWKEIQAPLKKAPKTASTPNPETPNAV